MFAIILLIYIICIAIFIHTNYIKIEQHEVKQPYFDLNIVHISDIHQQIRYINGSLSDILNRQNIDFLIVTGDLGKDEKSIKRVVEELKRINVNQKIYFVLGNYERMGKGHFKKRLLALNNQYFYQLNTDKFKVLINDYDLFKDPLTGEEILFYGFDNSIYGNEKYEIKLKDHTCALTILFAHSPNILNYIKANQIDYDMLLVGHTHGNQVNLPFIKKWRNPYHHFHRGYQVIDQKIINISCGLGTSRLPIRINSSPQITIFSLKNNKRKKF